jgi:hypothetical protein
MNSRTTAAKGVVRADGERRPALERFRTVAVALTLWLVALTLWLVAAPGLAAASTAGDQRALSPDPQSHTSRQSRSDAWKQCAQYAKQGVNPDACAAGVAAGMAASAKYRDVNRAIADGYVKFTDCESSPLGAMGEHWARVDRMVDPALDVRAPEILLYLNTPQGRKLLGFEYEQTASFSGLPVWGSTHPDWPVSGRPSLLGGKAFDGPMAGHSPIQPWHYDLHVYAWVKNPNGLFAQWNPAVKC